jgi:hypothetical protein
MTTEHEASRTLVKSPPELWAECSHAGSLARHLGEFGEITITRLEPETTVAWEGEHASGTVRIEPSGWGTRVTLTAQTRTEVPEAPPEAAAPPIDVAPVPVEPPIPEDTSEDEIDAKVEEMSEEPDPAPDSDVGALRIRWRRVTSRMRGLLRSETAGEAPRSPTLEEPADLVPETEAGTPDSPSVPEPPPVREVEVEEGDVPNPDPQEILSAALESLGQAHHRPFSRA